jgi:hypothetical protein
MPPDEKDRLLTEEETRALMDSLHLLVRSHEISAKIIQRSIYLLEKGEVTEATRLIRSIRPKWVGVYERIINAYNRVFGPTPFDHFNSNISNN